MRRPISNRVVIPVRELRLFNIGGDYPIRACRGIWQFETLSLLQRLQLSRAAWVERVFMIAMTRWLVRALLAIILFVPACSALVAISLLAMYSDRRYLQAT